MVPDNADVANLLFGWMFLPPIEGVDGDLVACICEPARLPQDAGVGRAGVGDKHHHMAHARPPPVEVMRIRRAVSG